MLDLGCGDVHYLSKTLRKNNTWARISNYTGVDLSEQAMQIGEKNVQSMLADNAHLSFIVDEMLSFVKKTPSASYDLVFASLSVHHLHDDDKQQLVQEIHRILKPNGAFMVVDLFLQEDEDRDHFAQDIADHIRGDWVKLTSEQRESLVNHMFNFDFPVKLTAFEHWAKENSLYKNVICMENLRFYQSIVLEA